MTAQVRGGVIIAAGLCTMGLTMAASAAENDGLLRTPQPRGDVRIVHASDHNNIGIYILTDNPTGAELRQFIDDLADNGVDILAQCVFAKQGVGWFWPEHPQHVHRVGGVDKIDSAEGLPIEIAIDQCHKRGMKFLAKFRMADRHSGPGKGLAGRPDLVTPIGAMDFTHQEVRDWYFELVEEILRRFDVDGFEFNYIRWMHTFPKRTARKSHPIMTRFVRRVREELDRAGAEKGRRLLLGARVPQTLKECRGLGYDVTTWAKEGLVDYLVPCDFFYTDFNARYEEFAAFTRDSDCMLYPAVHPLICSGNQDRLMRPENYRAVVRNFYAAGADGVSTFNYMYHWVRRFHSAYPGPPSGYPTALAWLRQMRPTERFDSLPRHYLFSHRNTRIVLKREVGSSGTYRFRIAEDLTAPGTVAELIVGATKSAEKDRLQFSINGVAVPSQQVKASWIKLGRDAKYGRRLDPCLFFMFRLTSPPARFGDNILGAEVVKTDAGGKGDIVIGEFEVTVLPPANLATQ